MILLNKADLADEEAVRGWAVLFEEKKLHAVCIDARNKGSLKQVQGAVAQACKEKTERDRRRGIMNRPIRAMVVGIPNVGKSTFINSFAGKACAKTGNKPGVTKGNQWIRLNKTLELLDTPGILWPRFEEEMVGVHLALIGSINDQILDKEELACRLSNILGERYPEVIPQRYGSEAQAGVCCRRRAGSSCGACGGCEESGPACSKAENWIYPGLRPCFSMSSAAENWDASPWSGRRIFTNGGNKMARVLKGEALEKELQRLEEMRRFEREYAASGPVCGIDEAGRGPLAGPVAAAAVILPENARILRLNDSKKLSPKVRDELFEEIKEKAVAWSVGIASPARIDEINILQATYEAMREALAGLSVAPGSPAQRRSDHSRRLHPSGSDHQGGCKEPFHRGGEHPGKGDQRPHDGRVRKCFSGLRL